MSDPKKYTASPGLFGGIDYYDEAGNLVGYSSPNVFGGYTNFDQAGNEVGFSTPTIFGGENIYDNHYNKLGEVIPAPFGGSIIDTDGDVVGTIDPLLPWGADITIPD